MKKKMLKVIIVIVIIIVLVLGGWYIMFTRFGVGPAFPLLPMRKLDQSQMEPLELAENQLMALADTEEQAQEIAEQYGITLVSYEGGTAVYHTEEDPFSVIVRGQENGYPELSLNYVYTIDDNGQMQK